MFNKVFISYASEDYNSASKIYDFLSINGYLPWLDKKKLLTGEKWDYRIGKELKESDFIILLLSSISVAKRGYVQREFKRAIEYSEEKLHSDIFIIPIKIDNCHIPDELGSFQWVKIDLNNLEEVVLKSLNTQRNKQLSSMPQSLASLNNYQIEFADIDLVMLKDLSFSVKYPVFSNSITTNTHMLNIAIKHYVNLAVSKAYNEFNADIESDLSELSLEDIAKSAFEVSFNTGIINHKLISVLFEEYTYYHGAAHPNYYYKTINCLFNPNRFPDKYIILNTGELKQLISQYRHAFDVPYSMSDSTEWFFEHDYPKEFETFITEDLIHIIFSNNMPHAIKALGYFEFPYKWENEKIILLPQRSIIK